MPMLCKKKKKIAFELRAVGDDLEETALPCQQGSFHSVHSPTSYLVYFKKYLGGG